MAPPFPLVRACIFDVDGTLINSEDIYTQIYNSILREYGKPELPWSIKALQQSRGVPGTMRVLQWANLDIAPAEWKAKGKDHVHLFENCQLLPGVEDLLYALQHAKTATGEDVKLALASSASYAIFDLKTSHLPVITEVFSDKRLHVFGDDPEMSEMRKKPQPDVFRLALKRINSTLTTDAAQEGQMTGTFTEILPEECLVFEDSIAGVEAARRAGMRVVWVPHPELAKVCRGKEMDILMGLTNIDTDGLVFEELEGTEDQYCDRLKVDGARLRTEDGWAEMRMSLEDFPLSDYGLSV